MKCFSVACLRTAFISNAGSLDPYPVRRDGGGDWGKENGANVGNGGDRGLAGGRENRI